MMQPLSDMKSASVMYLYTPSIVYFEDSSFFIIFGMFDSLSELQSMVLALHRR